MRDHRNLVVWRKSRDLSVGVLQLAERGVLAKAPRSLLDQVRRAAVSVQLNIAEGYAFRPAKRWTNHLRIALGSAVEVREVLGLIRDSGLARDPRMVTALLRLQAEVEAMLRSMLSSESRR